MAGWKKDELKIDFVPLFETIGDLRSAASVLTILYENETYRNHLRVERIPKQSCLDSQMGLRMVVI